MPKQKVQQLLLQKLAASLRKNPSPAKCLNNLSISQVETEINNLVTKNILDKEEAIVTANYLRAKVEELESELLRESKSRQIAIAQCQELQTKYNTLLRQLPSQSRLNQLKTENSTLKQQNTELEECVANLRNTISRLSQKNQ